MKPFRNIIKCSAKAAILAALAFGSNNIFADSQFLIEAGSTAVSASRQHQDWWSVVSGTWNNSSGNITAPGATLCGSRFMGSATAACMLSPVMTTPGGPSAPLWKIEFAHPTTTLVAGTVIDITMSGCSGLPATTTAFSAGANNAWLEIGTITLDPGVTTPTITFAWDPSNPAPPSGSFFNNRVYACEFRFSPLGQPCANTPALGNVNGPLSAGQTYVDVPGVTNGATAVTVYSDAAGTGAFTQIGQLTTGISTNVNRVTTSALVKDSHIIATQTVAGQESCQAGTGPIVGGGANPRIRVNLLMFYDPAYAGPAGAPGAFNSTPGLKCLGSAAPVGGGFLFAPVAGTVLNPDGCWQTVQFTKGTDSEYQIYSGAAVTPSSYAAFAGLAFCMDDTTDVGPFNIYVDNIMNGTNILQDFESPTNGTANYFFAPPRTSATTSPYLLSAPNVSSISTNNADTGTKSANLQWQFASEANTAWVLLPATGTNGTPQFDLSLPISARISVLPVGTATNSFQVTNVGQRTNSIGDNVTMSAAVLRGGGSPTYQWKKDGSNISGQTSATLTLNNVQTDANGFYSCVVANGLCSTESYGSLFVTTVVAPPTLSYSKSGNSIHFTWNGNFKLQSASAVTGTWGDVGATSPQDVLITGSSQFFRLVSP